MRLLHTSRLQLQSFMSDTPEYVILSHRWEDEEVTLQDMEARNAHSRHGYAKILATCAQAVRDGYEWVWIDSCCIDKSSSAELQEAINSMFRWYKNAEICYAYLSDISRDGSIATENIGKSKWFTRGWTLQELIAPRSVEFFDSNWASLGSKMQMAKQIEGITAIPQFVLRGGDLDCRNVAERLSWAAHRQVSREEDTAYSLLGLFSINMPLLYGEGGVNAFQRLLQEIYRYSLDHTIFLHTKAYGTQRSLLAGNVSQFCQHEICEICRADGYAYTTSPEFIPYSSLYSVTFDEFILRFGPGQIRQELIYVAGDKVLTSFRLVIVREEEGVFSARETQNLNGRHRAAVLRVRLHDGRWICIGLRPATAGVQDQLVIRNKKAFFIHDTDMEGRVNELLTMAYNSSKRSKYERHCVGVYVTLDSKDFELVQWRYGEVVVRSKLETDPGKSGSRSQKYSLETAEQYDAHHQDDSAPHTCVLDSDIITSQVSQNLHMYITLKDVDNPAILVTIRNLSDSDMPCLQAFYKPGLSLKRTIPMDHNIATDRCWLHLHGRTYVMIALRRKASMIENGVTIRRYTVSMTMETGEREQTWIRDEDVSESTSTYQEAPRMGPSPLRVKQKGKKRL